MNIAYMCPYCIENQKYKTFLLAEKSGRNIDVFNPKNGQKHHFPRRGTPVCAAHRLRYPGSVPEVAFSRK